MAYSSGTYSLYSPGNPVVTGTTISSTWANNTLSDVATALSTCLLKDGTQTVTANIPMSGFKLTGVGSPTATGDANSEGRAIGGTTPAAGTFTTLTANTSLVAVATVAVTGVISPAQITSDQNDYNPTNLATSSVLRLSTDANRNITGLQGGASGRIIWILNVGSFPITFKDASGGSSAANRFSFGGLDVIVMSGESQELVYDSTTVRWRITTKRAAAGGFQMFGGSGTFTTPANTRPDTLFKFTVIGAGGGGAGSAATGASGGGGNSGATALYYISGLTPSQACTVTIGAAGAAGTAGANNGGTGGNSSVVVGATTVTANGGVGGQASGSAAAANAAAAATATNGTQNISGAQGAIGNPYLATSIPSGGQGAPSSLGGGGAAGPAGNNGQNSAGIGSGGGGAGGNAGSNFAGGTGVVGLLFVEWVL